MVPPQPPPTDSRTPLSLLAFGLECYVYAATAPDKQREHLIKFLLASRDALKPVFREQGDLYRRVEENLRALGAQQPHKHDMAGLHQELRQVLQVLESAFSGSTSLSKSVHCAAPASKSIFVIHGHDELNRRRLVEMLREEFALSPVVILSQPGKSQTTIEKFEEHASACSYAISLLTPDDSVTNKASGACLQARPNVIFETGWFAGRLGRERVLILLQESVRIHSDLEGINQHRFKDSVEERFRDIQRELEVAGLVQRR